MLNTIFKAIDDLYPDMVQRRRYLHQHPELSFQETETAAYITDFYDKLGLSYQTNVGGNGIIAKLEGHKPGKTIALRADFDALPIQDEKDVPYRSTVDGVMHACGHDGHTATLLTLAQVMASYKEELPGTIMFLHQHAEEYAPGGAKPIVDSGALDEVDAVFGTHLWASTPFGVLETSKDVFMAGADRFEITVQGEGGHGAYPHETKDAIVIGTELITQLQQIVSRRLDPLETAVVTVGKFQAGDAFNIIADKAEIVGTVRHLNPDVQARIIDEMESIIAGINIAHGVESTLNYIKGYPPLINHEDEAALVMTASERVEGIHTQRDVSPSMGSEDFAYYLQQKPGAYFFTGAQLEGHAYPHHHPKFDFDERAMPNAAKTLISTYFAYQKV